MRGWRVELFCNEFCTRYRVKKLPSIVVLRPRMVQRDGKKVLSNIDRAVHVFEGAGPATLVALTAAIVQACSQAFL